MTHAPSKLSVFDATCIIVGIIIGTGIFESAPIVAAGAGSIDWAIGIWVIGGIISLCGALCYAELATTYPRSGGDYIYLSKAFGPIVGFLFAWGRSVIVQPCSIAAMAFPFARYMETLWKPFAGTPLEPHSRLLIALAAVALVTLLNCVAVVTSRHIQNGLTLLKILALLLIGIAGFTAPVVAPVALDTAPNLTLAVILVLFTYGGWNELAFVTSELRNPDRDITRSLVFGVSLVTVLYVLANASFFSALGFSGVASSQAVASESVAKAFPGIAASVVSAIICISTLSAINALTYVGARVSAALGENYKALGFLAQKNSQNKSPVIALFLQGLLTGIIIFVANSFEGAVVYATTIVYLFFFLTGLALPTLRVRDPNTARPYRLPWAPVTLLIYCSAALGMLWSAIQYNPRGSMVAFGILALGLPIYFFSARVPATSIDD